MYSQANLCESKKIDILYALKVQAIYCDSDIYITSQGIFILCTVIMIHAIQIKGVNVTSDFKSLFKIILIFLKCI